MDIGVIRDTSNRKVLPMNPLLLSAVQEIHESAKSTSWWEARVVMHTPEPSWRKPEALWRMHTDAEFLKSVEPFGALNQAELTRIAETATLRHFEPGEVIIREGDAGDKLFLISEGEVEVVRHDHEVARLGPAEFFGEAALLSGQPRNATVIATEPVDAYVVDKDDLDVALQHSMRFRQQFRRFFVRRR